MPISWDAFTPVSALAGGALIGAASALYLWGSGRIAGISGIVATPLAALLSGRGSWRAQRSRLAFLAGLLAAPLVWSLFAPLPSATLSATPGLLAIGGLLVGVGTRLGSGCTSGHGVCGLARLSVRSLVNVLVFMAVAFATVYIGRHLLMTAAARSDDGAASSSSPSSSSTLFGGLAGLVFGLGLLASGMADPAKVLAFLDLAGAWDPSLMLVMGGAIAVALLPFRLARGRREGWQGVPLEWPTSTVIDIRLIGGGVLFGIGWGLVGFCPGPALVALTAGLKGTWIFVLAMIAGMRLHDLLDNLFHDGWRAPGAVMIFRQLFDPVSSTYTYLLADPDTRQALLIDPVFEQARRDLALLRELDLQLLATLETHVHADHVTGAWLLQQRTGSQILLAAAAGAQGADRLLSDGDRVDFGHRGLEVRATPGHTDGCLSYVLDDRSMAFTGDALLIRGCGRTDFQQGSPQRLYRSVHERLLSLPPACLLYPGHDYRGLTVTSVAEERRWNPRFGGLSDEGDFVQTMNHLGLPHPKQMAVAVPANLRCGRPDGDASPPADPGWAPLVWSFAGLWEIEPATLQEVGDAGPGGVQVIDVRQPHEMNGPLGHIAGALNLPLPDLLARAGEIDPARPVVVVCRSGARSARAALMLGQGPLAAAGPGRVANLAGGMLRWRAERLPVVDARE